MDAILQDLRYAIRVLRRNGGFTLAAVLTLALGIGANASIFTVVNAVLLRPLPFGEPDRLMVVWMNNRAENIERDVTSMPSFRDWESRSRNFEGMAAYTGRRLNLTSGDGEPEEIIGAQVTSDFFDVLDAPLFAGRAFTLEEEIPGNHRVAILSHGLWQRRFGGDHAAVGSTVRLNSEPWTVVGVAAPGFRYPETAEIWTPLAADSAVLNSRGSLWLSVIGRMRPGATQAAAQAEMSAIADQLGEEYPSEQNRGVLLEALHETVVGSVRPTLLVLFGAVAFVLLIACANVANLLLARGAARRREVSVRLAVGAGRARLARQMLTESVVLALIGGLAGLGLAAFGVRALAAATPPGIPRLDGLAVDRGIVAFTFLVALMTGVLFGLAPALQAARASLSGTLREEERGAAGRLGRMRPILVVAEVALALVLLTGAGLMIRTFQALNDIDPGFDPEAVMTVRVTPPAATYPEPAQVLDFHGRFADALAALPGVRGVGAVSNVFLQRLPNMTPVSVEGAAPRNPGDPVVSVVFDAASPGFFDAFGVELVAGRSFDGTEDTSTPTVAVVNQSFVRQFMADVDPLGRRFTTGNPQNADGNWITVVGVIADARRSGPTEPVRPEAYLPHRQFSARSMTVLLRAAGNPLQFASGVRDVLRRIDPDVPIAQLSTLEQQMAQAQSARRFLMQMLLLFAAIAATLAAVGIYGVMSYLVSRRTRELGVRMAVGANRGDVVKLILRDALLQIGPGIALGIAGALGLARLMQSQLYGVGAADPWTLAAVALLLGTIALAASWVPAMRAARTDPLDALRID